jgi:putative endonuclease
MRLRGIGQRWERSAESFLEKHGLKTLRRNFHCRLGEVDLIMEHDNTLVFVEVRFRETVRHGSGAESVNCHKQRKIARAAAWFLGRNPGYAARACRFDVISVSKVNGAPAIRWIRNAFQSPLG